MTAQAIEWGVLVWLPHGADDVEEFGQRRGSAMAAADNINRRTPGAGKVVYRTVDVGPWTADTAGDEWAMQETWPDGHVEVHPKKDRREAAVLARGSALPTIRTVVSRTRKVGDWWLAEVPA